MVTNLPIRAKIKWAEVVAAKDPREKIRLMREFLALCPKHKGTEKLIAHVKRRIAQLEDELEYIRRVKARSRHESLVIEKSGDIQAVIIGYTKSGRSSLLSALTNAKPEISDRPFTTLKPIPGMLTYNGVRIQLIEAPPLTRKFGEGCSRGFTTLNLARTADCLIIMVDLSDDPVRDFTEIVSELREARILVEEPRGYVEIERTDTGGIRVVGGRIVDSTIDDIKKLLMSYRISSAIVRIHGEVTLDDIEDSLFGSYQYKPSIVVGSKIDLPGARMRLEKLKKSLTSNLHVIGVSCVTGEGLDLIAPSILGVMKIIRVYTKKPGNPPDPKPIVLREGSTVGDVASIIHTELKEKFRYARVWSGSIEANSMRVGLNYRLRDGDIVEIHTG
ncbi:MAG: TGS domain-containing protein [Candidatus Bathyarchaeia archaeon]|nr:TGS domain-containing protein [Candidatus Bathyarchaeota archaeon]